MRKYLESEKERDVEILQKWIEQEAEDMREFTGLWFREVEESNDSFEHLEQDIKRALKEDHVFDVYGGNSDNTIYRSNYHNKLFRYVHDCYHHIGGYDFSLEDEIELGIYQWKKLLHDTGLMRDSYAAKCFYLDTVGNRLYYAIHHKFVENGREFAEKGIKYGLIYSLTGIGSDGVEVPL